MFENHKGELPTGEVEKRTQTPSARHPLAVNIHIDLYNAREKILRAWPQSQGEIIKQ